MKILFHPSRFSLGFEVYVNLTFFLVFLFYESPMIAWQYMESGIPVIPQILMDLYGISFWPLYFVIMNMLFLVIFRSHIMARCVLMICTGVIIAMIKFIHTISMVDPVYFFVISTCCAATIALYRGDVLDEQLNSIHSFTEVSKVAMEHIRDSYKFILGKALQGWLALAASLGLSMSIIFKDGWGKRELYYGAIKMLLGFVGISIAAMLWIGIPLLNGIVDVQNRMIEFYCKRSRGRKGRGHVPNQGVQRDAGFAGRP